MGKFERLNPMCEMVKALNLEVQIKREIDHQPTYKIHVDKSNVNIIMSIVSRKPIIRGLKEAYHATSPRMIYNRLLRRHKCRSHTPNQ